MRTRDRRDAAGHLNIKEKSSAILGRGDRGEELAMTVARIVLLCFAAGLSCMGFAQQNMPTQHAPRRVVTTTRLVAVFSELETQWWQAVQNKDEAALRRLLGEDFQVWMPDVSGPVAREDWQQQAFARKWGSFHLRQMAVRLLNDETAVASFVLSQSVQSRGKPQADDYFVVDIWSKNGDHWVCTDRYASLVSRASGLAPVEDAKPSGKQ